MAISDTISSMTTNISNAYSSIQAKSGTIPANKNLQNLSTAIDSIPSGGSPTPTTLYSVRVFDYDGTILKSEDLATGDTFTMPTAPTHSGLTFQEWTGSATVTNNTITVGSNDIMMGAIYTTTSGLTEIDVELTKASGKNLTLSLYNGNIDWGDGTTDYSSGTSITHTYADYGKYTVTHDGTYIANSYIAGSSGNSVVIDVRIGSNVSTISSNNFTNCFSLKTVTLPNTIQRINGFGFRYCYSLKSINFPNSLTRWSASNFTSCYSLETIVLPQSILTLDGLNFENCYSLKNVNMSSVTNLGNSVFRGCYALEKINIPSGNIIISDSMFNNCRALTDVTLPNTVDTISPSAFQLCYALENINFPSSLVTIREYAFQMCYKLKSAILPNGIRNLGYEAFSNCYSLTDVTLPNTITQINRDMFANCYALKNVTIPSGITTIRDNVFSNCYSLRELTFPSSISSIDSAFSNNYSIEKYDFSACSSIPTIYASNTFYVKNSTKIIVPDSLYDTWITASNWSAFANYIYRASEVS